MATRKKATKRPVKKRETKMRTPPFESYSLWSEAKFWGFIRAALRKASSRWPPKFEVLKAAQRPYQGEGRQKWEYQCAMCGEWFPQKQVSVDHIVPAGTLKSFEDLPEFTRKLFVGIDGLQVLCDAEHAAKTLKEREDAREIEGR